MPTAPYELGSFRHGGHRLSYEVHGQGPRVLVYVHGLLLDANLNRDIARRLAARGHRVVLLDLLGHGRSARPTHAYEHRFDLYGEQVLALLDHLGLDDAVVGGVSLGANTTLAAAAIAPERVRAMVVEMPVLERGAVFAAGLFLPLLVATRYLGGLARPLAWAVRHGPRTSFEALDSFLNVAGRDPRETAAVLHGLFFGPTAPTIGDRRALDMPALVIGHDYDLLHPMDDAVALSRELPNAELVEAVTALELRVRPERLVTRMDTFLRRAWRPRAVAESG